MNSKGGRARHRFSHRKDLHPYAGHGGSEICENWSSMHWLTEEFIALTIGDSGSDAHESTYTDNFHDYAK